MQLSWSNILGTFRVFHQPIKRFLVFQEIAGMFSAVGMCEQAVAAFTKV